MMKETKTSGRTARLELLTSIKGVRLRELLPDDADAYKNLLEANRNRLNQFADAYGTFPLEEVRKWLSGPREMDLRMGIHIGDLGEHLVGLVQVSHISLAQGENLPDSPDVFALGYWIAADSAGKGYTTACCLALMEYARDKLGAKQFLSATHPMNRSSARVLDKLGFSVYEESEDRFRYKLQLEENS